MIQVSGYKSMTVPTVFLFESKMRSPRVSDPLPVCVYWSLALLPFYSRNPSPLPFYSRTVEGNIGKVTFTKRDKSEYLVDEP